MAHKNIDRCKETTSTTGTGTLTLTGAVSGFVGAANATNGLTVDGDTGWFCAQNDTEWEVFLGTRVTSTTLARTTVISSSNAGSAVSFTAAPTVFSTVPGAKLSPIAGPAFRAYRSSGQSLSGGVDTKIAFNAESFDVGGCFDSTTNNRWTPNVAGYYPVQWAVQILASSGDLSEALVKLFKNGAVIALGRDIDDFAASKTAALLNGADLVYMNGTTDYLEIFVNASASSGTVVVSGESKTYFSGHLAMAG